MPLAEVIADTMNPQPKHWDAKFDSIVVQSAQPSEGKTIDLDAHRKNRLLGERVTVQAVSHRLSSSPFDGELVQASPVMRALVASIALVARSDTPVLILGESGTGKERVASRECVDRVDHAYVQGATAKRFTDHQLLEFRSKRVGMQNTEIECARFLDSRIWPLHKLRESIDEGRLESILVGRGLSACESGGAGHRDDADDQPAMYRLHARAVGAKEHRGAVLCPSAHRTNVDQTSGTVQAPTHIGLVWETRFTI